MNPTYLFYEILLIPFLIFFLWVTKNRVLKDEPTYTEYALSILFLLVVWGEVAVYFNQWYFPKGVNLGIYILTHPIELYLEAILIPLLIISIWEFVKRRR